MPKLDILSPYGAIKFEGGVAVRADIATIAALKALSAADPIHVDGNVVTVAADGSRWVYHSTSALTGDDLFVVDPTNAAGRWLREAGTVDLKLPIAFGTADAAVLATVPAGARFLLRRGYWEITTAFAGGTLSAIGASSSNAAHSTKGDLHGGAAGNVEAELTAGVRAGTIGADVAAGVLLVAGNTVRFDRVTDAFTSGAGFLHLVGELVLNPGA